MEGEEQETPEIINISSLEKTPSRRSIQNLLLYDRFEPDKIDASEGVATFALRSRHPSLGASEGVTDRIEPTINTPLKRLMAIEVTSLVKYLTTPNRKGPPNLPLPLHKHLQQASNLAEKTPYLVIVCWFRDPVN